MTDFYSTRPFISHAGADSNGVRAEVLVTKGVGVVTNFINETDRTAQVEISVPGVLTKPLKGWLNKTEEDGKTPNPPYEFARKAMQSGEPISFRIENQRRRHMKSDKSQIIDPKTPIFELMGADADGKNKNPHLVDGTTVRLLVGVGDAEGGSMLFSQRLTSPAEDPSFGGPTAAPLDPPVGESRPTAQGHGGGFHEVQPWFAINPTGEVNPGSYAVDALIDYLFWTQKYAEDNDLSELNTRRVKILAANLAALTDRLQIDVYNGRLDAADRSIGSYREARAIIKGVATWTLPLKNVDMTSGDGVKNWINDVYETAIKIWKWSIEEYAATVGASPYGD